MEDLRENLSEVERRISDACARSGRRRSDVRLLAVSKTFPAAAISAAYGLGLREFGENYVQEFEQKVTELVRLEGARFHFIGHLQSNKSRKAAELFEAIETVDSARLARRLNECGRKLEVFIEVKLSNEAAKHGCAEADLPAVIDAIAECENLTLSGLMTMPPWAEDAELSRPCFARLRRLAEAYGLTGLSMGMSHDLEVAIEEGSTLVRVGTALFGSRRSRG